MWGGGTDWEGMGRMPAGVQERRAAAQRRARTVDWPCRPGVGRGCSNVAARARCRGPAGQQPHLCLVAHFLLLGAVHAGDPDLQQQRQQGSQPGWREGMRAWVAPQQQR